MKVKDIIDAYVRIRTIDNTIPDEVLDYMRKASLEKLYNDDKESVDKEILEMQNKTTTP